MQTLRGRLINFFLEDAKGRKVALKRIMRAVGEPDTDRSRERVRQAINNLKGRPGDSGVELETVERGAVWRQTNYVETDPGPADPHDGGPLADDGELSEPELEVRTTDHVCPYTVAGLDALGQPIVRNSGGQLYRLTAL